MSDDADLAAERLDVAIAARLSLVDAAIPAGVPGECDDCGELMPRLVGGRCAFCRDGRRPPLSTFDRLASPVATPVNRSTGDEEKPVPSPKYATKVISAPVESQATLARIEQYASKQDLPLGRATIELAVAGLDAVDAPDAVSASSPLTIVSLETVPAEWLTEELQRRLNGAADPALIDAAIARAEASEDQLATLRQQLLGLLGGGGGAVSPFTTSTVRDGDVVRLTVLLSTDAGPAREFRPFLDVDLDEPHAVMLFGELWLALQSFADERGDTVVAFPGRDD